MKMAEQRIQALTKKEEPTIKALVQQYQPEIQKALPTGFKAEQFARIVTTAITTNPKLNNCTPASFLGAMLTSAQIGLIPNSPLGHSYMIPYYNGKAGETECQFQIGYKGYLELAHRGGMLSIDAKAVSANDTFQVEYGLNPKLVHIPNLDDPGPIKYYYAVFHLKDGGFGFEIMSKAEIEAHAKKFSKSASYGPWVTNFDEMAKKTVIKRVLKYAPLDTETALIINQDESIKRKSFEDLAQNPEVDMITEPTIQINPETGEVIEN